MEWKHECKGCKKLIDSPTDALLGVYALYPKAGGVYWHTKCFVEKTREARQKYGFLIALAAGPLVAANTREDVELQLKAPSKLQDVLANQKIGVVLIFGVVLAYAFSSGSWEKLDALARAGIATISVVFAAIVFATLMFFVELRRFRQVKAAWLAAQGKTMIN